MMVRKEMAMSAAEGWARDFYTGLFVDLWLALTPEHQTRQEADFLEKVLCLPAGASIVDLACGGGRHCLELAARGYRLTGVDSSPAFLAVARAAATARGLAVRWEERAMHDLPWAAAIDGAICMGNSLGGLDDAGLAAFFRAVAHTLKPASRLVVETRFVAESLLPNLKERHWALAGDVLWLYHSRYDLVQGRLHMDFTFIREGQVEKKSGFGQVHTYKEFCRLIEEAGFHALEGYASPAQEPYRLGSPELFLVATKKGS
jgi:SAM-dependent methyltransferase